MHSSKTDILIVGSGPVGAAFARTLHDLNPAVRITMLEAGPSLTRVPGTNVKNIADPQERIAAQIRAQGPSQYRYTNPTVAVRAEAATQGPTAFASILARPGTFLLGRRAGGMPAASMSANVGGMGAHWSCACPRPADSEQIAFIDAGELDACFTRAEALLRVSQTGFDPAHALQDALRRVFPIAMTGGRAVQPMPLACSFDGEGHPVWSGSDTVLGSLVTDPEKAGGRFELKTETVCRGILHGGGRASGVLAHDLRLGEDLEIEAKAVVVACDALRTPQLLWASEVRPFALGRYLNDQPQVICAISLDPRLAPPLERGSARPRRAGDTTLGVLWVPFHDPAHPFHGQVMRLDASPIPVEVDEPAGEQRQVVALGWFCAKEIRPDDRIEFDGDSVDHYGLPAMALKYELTDADREMVGRAEGEQLRAVEQLGEPLHGQRPTMIPAGSSLHYQGTSRMGEDRETSVCDAYSRVWGFDNLFVGGNGVIPTATACNPTLTAVALAVRSSQAVLEALSVRAR